MDVDFEAKMEFAHHKEPHFDSENAYSFSVELLNKVILGAEEKIIRTFGTSTILNVNTVILNLHAYGGSNDLQWTRNASKQWSKKILNQNIRAPKTTNIN